MSTRPKTPKAPSKPKAALTARQRHRLNDARPSVPDDHPNQGASQLITTRAAGMRVLDMVRRAGVAKDLQAQVDGPSTRRGPKRRVSVEALLVAMVIAARADSKSYHRSAVLLALIGLDADVAYQLGVCTNRKWRILRYKTVARLVKELEQTLLLGWFQDGEYRDFEWLATRLLKASIPQTARRHIKAAALDETPRPTWARRTTVFENQTALVKAAEQRWRDQHPNQPLPSDPAELIPTIEAEAARRGYRVGPDGRLIHGKDIDARMGYASATSELPSGFFVGYGLTLLVACQEALWRGDPDRLELGEEVPLYILALAVDAAGTNPGPTGGRVFTAGRTNAPNLKDVVTDRGYSTKRTSFVRLVQQAGANLTQDYKQYVRRRLRTIPVGSTKKTKETIHMHCGTFLPAWITKYWQKPPARLLRPDKKDELAAWFARRAALVRFADRGHYKTKAGVITGKRFKCPACAGFCDDPTATAPPSYDHPPLAKPDTPRCCGGSVTIKIEDLYEYQLVPYGTPAWHIAYGRRNLVETVNSMLKPEKGRHIGRCQALGLGPNWMASIALAVAHNLQETIKARRARRAATRTRKPKPARQPNHSQAKNPNDATSAEPSDKITQTPPTTTPDAGGDQPPSERPPERAPP